MKTVLFFVVIILLACFFLAVIKGIKAKGTRSNSSFFKKIPLSEVEQVAYWRLIEAMGADKIVLSQVAFSSFIGAKGGNKKENFSKFATARQKVADFVICNKDFSIFAIVEVDDKSHNVMKDELRDAITEAAGIKTYRIEAKALPSVNELREAIK